MKRESYVLLILLMVLLAFAGCKKSDKKAATADEEKTVINEEQNSVEETEPEKTTDAANEAAAATEESDATNESGASIETETITISQKEAEAACDKMLSDLEMYLFEIMYLDNDDMYNTNMGEVVINLDAREITRASALSTTNLVDRYYYLNEDDEGKFTVSDNEDSGDVLVEELSKKQLNETSKNLFGKECDAKSLEIFSPDSSLYDAVRMNKDDEFASRLFYQYENEGVLDYLGQKTTIGKDTITYEKEAYCGYWGYIRFSKSNFRITVEFTENPDSAYGLVIKSIKYQRTENENDWVMADTTEDEDTGEALSLGERTDNHPFWGIFVYSSKDIDKAVEFTHEVREKGFDADYLDTPSWSGLNPEFWIAVTAGKYDTKEAAEAALKDVKAAGYENAYIRYTGEYSLEQY